VGLPGTNGFVGEFLILLGGFLARPWAALVAASGLILGAWYMLWLYQRIFFNPVNAKVVGIRPMNVREICAVMPLVILVFWIGLYPNALLDFMHVSVANLLQQVTGDPTGFPAAVQQLALEVTQPTPLSH
jgi:NADH-quinone oxidoreductase subunit M